jgi:hypothetical protein
MKTTHDPDTKETTLTVEDTDLEQIDSKYIVFKRGEFVKLVEEMLTRNFRLDQLDQRIESVVLPDAVVIRTKDRFAGPALHAYSQSIALVASVSPADRHNLLGAADYMHRRALEADEIARAGAAKFPD